MARQTASPMRSVIRWAPVAGGLAVAACTGGGKQTAATAGAKADSSACGAAGLTLPQGFCATVFADSIGHGRHVAVAANGDVYVNTTPGRRRASEVATGGVIVAMRDTNHDGRADVIARFGPDAAKPGTGGTGIAVHGGYVYAEDGTRIVRYKLQPGQLVPDSTP
jgi:glucose/arabinose dehydrogenase